MTPDALPDLARRAAAAVAAGKMTRQQAEAAVGFAALELADAPETSHATHYRRLRLLARLGVVSHRFVAPMPSTAR